MSEDRKLSRYVVLLEEHDMGASVRIVLADSPDSALAALKELDMLSVKGIATDEVAVWRLDDMPLVVSRERDVNGWSR